MVAAVFFGEQLPERFFQLAESDLRAADLLIIMGTSLKVQPFASLVGLVDDDVPRLLINREEVGTEPQPILKLLGFIDDRALDFDDATRYRDACFLGDCDEGVRQLAAHLDDAVSACRAAIATSGAADSSENETGSCVANLSGEWVESLLKRVASHPMPRESATAPPPSVPPSASVMPQPVAAAIDPSLAFPPPPVRGTSSPAVAAETAKAARPAAVTAPAGETETEDSTQLDADGVSSPEHKAARRE